MMKPINENYSTLSSWRRLWDYRLTCGLRERDFKKLRLLGFDVDKVSFQLVSTSATRNGERKHVVPQWAANTVTIRQLLLKHFPALGRNKLQRLRAGRWAVVIQLYHRMGWSRSKIAGELGITTVALTSLLRSIKRASEGRSADGLRILGRRPRGRPKKLMGRPF